MRSMQSAALRPVVVFLLAMTLAPAIAIADETTASSAVSIQSDAASSSPPAQPAGQVFPDEVPPLLPNQAAEKLEAETFLPWNAASFSFSVGDRISSNVSLCVFRKLGSLPASLSSWRLDLRIVASILVFQHPFKLAIKSPRYGCKLRNFNA